MELKDLIKELEAQIDTRMTEICSLIKESKKLSKQLETIHFKIADIYESMDGVHPLIKNQHPDHDEFISAIIQYKKERNMKEGK